METVGMLKTDSQSAGFPPYGIPNLSKSHCARQCNRRDNQLTQWIMVDAKDKQNPDY
jgi:hypothetical protein